MFSMMTLELSNFEELLIFVQVKKMILCKFYKYNFSPNGIYAVKWVGLRLNLIPSITFY